MAAWVRKSGADGSVTLTYTVTKKGKVKDIEVAESCHKMFIKPSIKAATKFVYLPAIVDGVAVDTPLIRNKFIFKVPPKS